MHTQKGNNASCCYWKSEDVGLTGMRWCALAMTVLLLASARTAAAQAITEFPIRTAAASIVAGPDGALWFTGEGQNKIGRITTAGTVTEFLIPVPPRALVYTGIAAGPDGALWFGIAKAPASLGYYQARLRGMRQGASGESRPPENSASSSYRWAAP
jgi:streptogramin lyase